MTAYDHTCHLCFPLVLSHLQVFTCTVSHVLPHVYTEHQIAVFITNQGATRFPFLPAKTARLPPFLHVQKSPLPSKTALLPPFCSYVRSRWVAVRRRATKGCWRKHHGPRMRPHHPGAQGQGRQQDCEDVPVAIPGRGGGLVRHLPRRRHRCDGLSSCAHHARLEPHARRRSSAFIGAAVF